MSETFAQSVLSCVGGSAKANNSSMVIENESTLNSFSNSNVQDNFENWKVISGSWKTSSSSLEGGTGINNTNSVDNIIINPGLMKNISEIEATFTVNETNPNLASYAYIIYSYKDPENFKIAGIHIANDDIFVRFAAIANGCLTTQPSYIYTGIDWQPNSTFNLALSSENGIQALKLNDTQFAGNNNTNIDGVTGLLYGRINGIDFSNFSVSHPFATSDSQTLLLGDRELPSNDFIHLYDSSPYEITEGHISAVLPCNEDNNTDVQFLMGQFDQLQTEPLQFVQRLSITDDLCQYGLDVRSTKDKPITDIMIQNNSTEDIEFPLTSSIIITINQMKEKN
jgi:hypothetical protein